MNYCGNGRKPGGKKRKQTSTYISGETGLLDSNKIFPELTPLELIETLKPDVIIKGGDWKEENVVGWDAVRTWGGQVVIIPETEGASTTNIVTKVLEVYGRN